MKNLAFRYKLWGLSILLILVAAFVGGVAIWNLQRIDGQMDQVALDQFPAVREITTADMHHEGVRAIVMEGMYRALEGNQKAVAESATELEHSAEEFHQLMINLRQYHLAADTQGAINAILPVVDLYIESARKVFAHLTKEDLLEASNLLPAFDREFHSLESTLDAAANRISEEAHRGQAKAQAYRAQANWGISAALVFGLIAGFALAWYLTHRLDRDLGKVESSLSAATEKLNAYAWEVATASDQLNTATQGQASAIQETVTALDEISAMVSRGADAAGKTGEVATSSYNEAMRGKETVSDLQSSMNEIQHSTDNILTAINHSNEEITSIVGVIREISEKTKVINDIVFQTKLLSFNASVEAARAGEHGKGFAVVAEEVGNLAQMSGNASREIDTLLNASIDRVEGIVKRTQESIGGLVEQAKAKVQNGVEVSKDCESTFGHVVDHVGNVKGMMSEISLAAQEQTMGVGNIASAMSDLDRSNQSNAHLSSELQAKAQGLLAQAQQLIDALCGLQKELGHESGLGATAAPSAASFASEYKTAA